MQNHTSLTTVGLLISVIITSSAITNLPRASTASCSSGQVVYPDSFSEISLPSAFVGFDYADRVAVDSTLHRAFFSQGDHISVMDTTNNNIIHSIKTSSGASSLGINEATHRLFAKEIELDDIGSFNVLVIDTNTYALVANISTGHNMANSLFFIDSIGINEITNKAYVFLNDNDGNGVLEVIDGATNSIMKSFAAGDGTIDWGSLGPVVDEVHNVVYKANANSIMVIDGSTDSVKTTIPFDSITQLFSMAVDGNSNRLYVGTRVDVNPEETPIGRLVTIDTNTNSVISTLDLGPDYQPYSLAVDPANKKVWAAEAYAQNPTTGSYGNIQVFDVKESVPTLDRTYWISRSPGAFQIALDTSDVATKAFATEMGFPRIVIIDYDVIGCSPSAIEVNIDINPGSKSNVINPGSKGVIPVGIITSDTIDAARDLDPSTVSFGPSDAVAVKWKIKDIDKDGNLDLLLFFKTQDTGIACGDTEASISDHTTWGTSITGTDTVKTVHCK